MTLSRAFWGLALLCVAGCQQSGPDLRAPVMVERAQDALLRQDYHQALTLADSAITLDPGLADGFFVKGRVLFEVNQFAASQVAYENVLRLDPAYPGAHHNLGNALFGQKQFQEAVEHFQREASLRPAPNASHAAGAALMELGQPESALQNLLSAASSDSTYQPVHKTLAELYEQMGQYPAALKHALIADDDYLVGLMLFRLNRFDEAAPRLQSAIESDPLHFSAFYTLGQLYLRQSQNAEAEGMLARAEKLRQNQQRVAALETAARENPASFAHQIAHAAGLQESGRLAEAIDAWLIALALRPGNLGLESNIATAHMQLGNTTQGISRYERILSADSTHVTALINLGWHYFQTERRQNAVELWARAARHHPDHTAVQALRETLEQFGSAQNRPAQ